MKYKVTLLLITFTFIFSQNIFSQEKTIKELHPSEFYGVELKLDGVVICDKNGDRIHNSSLKQKFNENSTVKNVVDILGPGYLPKMSGTGSITWYFADSSKIITHLWPDSLNSKVKLIYRMPE